MIASRNTTSYIRGIVPPMVTPLSGPDQLDVAGLERLVEHLLAGGVHGLFILGTTGEGPSLSYALRREMIERVHAQVNGRAPLFVGVTDTSYTESIALARHAARCGAHAAVIAPPYYFPAGQPELLAYFQDILAAMPLPVMIYNMPGCTKINIDLDTLPPLLDHPKVIGFKDSGGDMAYFHRARRLCAAHGDKPILIGPEEMLADAVLLGGHGGISGGANLFPRLYVDLYNAATAGDSTTSRRLHEVVLSVSELYRIGRHASSTIKGIKCALACMGICDDVLAAPFHRFSEPERARVRRVLDALPHELHVNRQAHVVG